MENKGDDEPIQNSYLSSLFYRQVKLLNQTTNTVSNALLVPPSDLKKQKVHRNKTQICLIKDLNQQFGEGIKRKNSFSGNRKLKKVEQTMSDSKCTPYQNRKRHDRLKLMGKKEKVSLQIEKIPFALQQTKGNWLIVKQAMKSCNSSPRLKTQPPSQRLKVYFSNPGNQQIDMKNTNYFDQPIKMKPKNDSKNESDKQKSIKIMLSYYRNKNVIKHHLKLNKAPMITNSELKQSINFKLSTLPEQKKSLKGGIKEKVKHMYISKRQLTFKNKKDNEQSSIVTENMKNNLLVSTHSDLTDNRNTNHLKGVLNLFKVDMKFKEKVRPRTAEKHFKSDSNFNHRKNSKKNASTKVVEMTGWQDQPDKFQRDNFFC